VHVHAACNKQTADAQEAVAAADAVRHVPARSQHHARNSIKLRRSSVAAAVKLHAAAADRASAASATKP